MNVMIADGTRVGCKRVENLISGADDVVVVGTTESADALLRSLDLLSPDALILDIEIGGRGGMSLLRKILLGHPSLSVIVLTNAVGRTYRRQCFEAGALYFIDKATEFHKTGSAIAELLRGSRAPLSTTPSTEGELS